jgi:hypothetical protein
MRHVAALELPCVKRRESRDTHACGGSGVAEGLGGGSWRHMASPELLCARRREPRDTRVCASVLPFVFDLKLIHMVT